MARFFRFFPPNVDAVIVLDDWKGPESGKPDSPVYFVARIFQRHHIEEVRALNALLRDAGADRWHGSKGASLFTTDKCDRIFAQLNCMGSWLFSQLSTFGHYDESHRLQQQMAKLRPDHPHWDFGNNYSAGLFQFLCHLHPRLVELHAEGVLPSKRIRVICDRQDWQLQRHGEAGMLRMEAKQWETGVPYGFEFEVYSVGIKDHPDVEPYLPFLGLIDSEAWAFGIVQMGKVEDGSTTVRDKIRAWQDRGSGSELVLAQEEFDHLFANLKNPLISGRVQRYIEAIRDRWETIWNVADKDKQRPLKSRY